MLFNGDWEIAATGIETVSLKPTLWTTIYGEGVDKAAGTWGGLDIQQQAESDAAVAYSCPFLGFTTHYLMRFLEADTFSGGATRVYRSHITQGALWNDGAFIWRTPAPVNYTNNNGLALAVGAT